jgi:hypothetical protein
MPHVTYLPERERRQHERFPQVFDVRARCLLSFQIPGEQPREFEGRIQNLSNGGACILSSCSLQPNVFVCCNFPVVDSSVSVPALMQVRWTAKRGQKSPNYVSGFQFVV